MSIQSRRVFFLATDNNTPSGGLWMIYQMVAMLVESGIKAYALHQTRGFRYDWFEHEVPVAYTYDIYRARWKHLPKNRKLQYWKGRVLDRISSKKSPGDTAITFRPDDILVIPENRMHLLDVPLGGASVVILVQGPYLHLGSLSKVGLNGTSRITYITTSELGTTIARQVSKKAPIHHVPLFTDASKFHYSEKKRKQIAYMPRRLSADSDALMVLLKARNQLCGYELVPIDGFNHSQVAKTLCQSLIFLSFSHREGFGLPAAEAMACGCLVVGYTGNGGDEFFDNVTGFPIPEGDLMKFASCIEQLISDYDINPASLDQKRQNAASLVSSKYSRRHTKMSLLQCMNSILEYDL